MKLPPAFIHLLRIWSIVLGLFVLRIDAGYSQQNIRFEHISVNDGLSQADVRTITQDNFGFLWVGTRDGLNRYDGFEFTKYVRRPGDSTSLHFNQIWDIEADSAGNIWIGSTGGISRYNQFLDEFENYFFSEQGWEDVDVKDINVRGPNSVLLGTGKGLVKFNLKSGEFEVSPEFESFKSLHVFHTYHSKHHGMWVATEKGLFVKSPETSEWNHLVQDCTIQHIDADPNSNIYVSTSKGLLTYNPKTKEISKIELPPTHTVVNEVLRMANGDLWVASDKIIVFDDKDVVKSVLEHDQSSIYSLSEDRARTFYQTDDNVIWVGTFGYGLNKFDPDVAKFYHLNEVSDLSLSSNYVSTIFTTDDTTLLVGTSRGLDHINLKTKAVKHFQEEGTLFHMFKVHADRRQNIYVGSSKGLLQYTGGRLVSKDPSLGSVVDFSEWDESSLIVATRVRGVYLFNRTTETTTKFIPVEDLPADVACLLVEDDRLWLGSIDGLRLYDRNGKLLKHFRAVRNQPGTLPVSYVKGMYRDSRRTLWIGTWGGGLCKFNAPDSTFTTFTVTDGLSNNVVYGIVEDYSGMLWMSTNNGLSAFSPYDQQFQNFDFYDGLQSNEFNTGAYFKSVSGRLYFGGINGVSFFDPEAVIQKRRNTSVLTTAITLNNRPLSSSEGDSSKNPLLVRNIESTWRNNDIGIEFTSIDFKHANKYTFQYSVDDTTWYNIGNRRSLELLDLPVGQHQIKVRAKKPGGEWSRNEVLLAIDIIPPLWQQTWFKVLIALMLVAVPVGLYNYRVSIFRKKNEFLNAVVDLRTREIQTKNEEISAQNQEMVAQNEELKLQSELLEEKNSLLQQRQQDLIDLSSDLENRVDERTKDIQLLNKDLMDRNMQLEQFSFIAAHNFNGPVARLRGLFDMIPGEVRSDPNSSQILSHIKTTIKDLEEVTVDVNRVLVIKRESNDFFEVVNLREAIDRVIVQLDEEIRKREAIINLADFQSTTMKGSKAYMQNIMFNLLQNSIKFSKPDGRCVIKVTCVKNENLVKLEFIDNGIGIDLKMAWNKIFRLYQRFAFGTSGRGFGLFLVKAQVEQMRGEISVESAVGVGSKFTITFPSADTQHS